MSTPFNLTRLRDNAAAGRSGLIVVGAAAATVLIVFGFLTWRELRRWQGRERPDVRVLAARSAFAVGYDIYIQGNDSNQRGELEDAARRYRESLKIIPGFAPAHYNLGVLLAKRGRLDEAMDHYRDAVRFNPGDAEAHNNLGAGLAQRGKLDEAMNHYREAARLRPDFAEAHLNLALALDSRGKLDEAVEHYRRAASLRPGFTQAEQALAQAIARQARR